MLDFRVDQVPEPLLDLSGFQVALSRRAGPPKEVRLLCRRRADPDSLQRFEEEEGEEYEEYELSESEAIALSCLEELEESSEAGHAVQLHLAAHAAFGKAKGKGNAGSRLLMV